MKNGSYAGRRSIRTGPVGAGHAPPVREAAIVPPIRCAAPFPLLRCPDVSLRGAKRRGNLGKAVTILPGLSCDPAGYCEIATGAKRPRNDKSLAFTVLTKACTGCKCSAGRGMPLPYNGVCGRRWCPEICSCQWRSLSAATDAIGACHFNGSRYETALPFRDCHWRKAPSQ